MFSRKNICTYCIFCSNICTYMVNYAGAQKRSQNGSTSFLEQYSYNHEPVFSMHIYSQKHANEDMYIS